MCATDGCVIVSVFCDDAGTGEQFTQHVRLGTCRRAGHADRLRVPGVSLLLRGL